MSCNSPSEQVKQPVASKLKLLLDICLPKPKAAKGQQAQQASGQINEIPNPH